MSKGFIHHIEIYVSNLERSVNFWRWFLEELDYVPFQKWEYGHSWKIEDIYLVFVQTEDRSLDEPYHRCRVGLNHLAFHAESREQVDSKTEKLKKKSTTNIYRDKHPNAGDHDNYVDYIEHPDTIKI